MEDYYKILDINYNATINEIKEAYKKLIHKYHPDISKNNTDKFKILIKAYKTLSDPVKKSEYDKELKRNIPNFHNDNLNNEEPKKSVKREFLISSIINKQKLESFFSSFIKSRNEAKRRKFIEREKSKLTISESYNFCENLSKIEIISRLRNSSNYHVRLHAARYIGKLKNPEYTFELAKALSDSSSLVRKEVISSLGQIGDYRALNFLINCIYDYDNEVKLEIAKVLRKFEDKRAITALIKLLKDSDEKVVEEAIFSLGVIGNCDILPEIKKMLSHESLKVKKAALEVIRYLK